MRKTPAGNRWRKGKIALGALFALAAGMSGPVFAAEPPTPVFVDADLSQGSGQLASLALGLRLSEIQIAGISTVASASESEESLLGDWIVLCGRHDIPLFTGPGKPASRTEDLRDCVPQISGVVSDRHSSEGLQEVSNSRSGKLQVVILGSPLRVARALEGDSTLGGRIAGIHWVLPEAGKSHLDPEKIAAARTILDSTLPLTLYHSGKDTSAPVTLGLLNEIGKTHSVLTDAVTHMLAEDLGRGATPDLSASLPFLRIANRVSAQVSDSSWEIDPSGAFREGAGRKAEWVHSASQDEIHKVFRVVLTDIRRDFSLEFTRFLFGLSTLSPDSRTLVQQALKEEKAKEPDEATKKDPDDLRHQMLGFIESKVRVLGGIEDPAAESIRTELKQVYRTIAGNGWYFPRGFYGEWFLRAETGQPLSLKFGVSNATVRPVEKVQATVLYGTQVKSQEVASATGDIVLPFEIGPIKPASDAPAKVDLFLSWEIGGFPYSASRSIPLRLHD